MNGNPKTVACPDGYRPIFKYCGFAGFQLDRLSSVKVTKGKPEEWTEAEAHFALSKLLEHQEHLDEAIRNARTVISGFVPPMFGPTPTVEDEPHIPES